MSIEMEVVALREQVRLLRERVRALETVASAAQALRDNVKALKEQPPLRIGEVPPWHLLDKVKQLNATLDEALALAATEPKEAK